jgi:hypothetical protein
MWAEQVAGERRLGAEVVPAPADSNAKCDLALECLNEDLPVLRQALEEAGIPYRVYVRSGAGDGGA